MFVSAQELALLANTTLDIVAALRRLNVAEVSPDNIEEKIAEREANVDRLYKEAMK